MLGLLIRLLLRLLTDIVAPGSRSHVIKGVVAVVIRLCIKYLLSLLVVFIEKSALNLHWSIAELDLSSRWSPVIVSVMLLRPIGMGCVVVLVVVLRETIDGCRRR